MQPQGAGVINTAYFDALTAEINATNVCGNLQSMINRVTTDIQAWVNGIEDQIASLLPLTTIPHDLPSVITWITNMAQPYIAAYNKLIQQITQVLSHLDSLVSAVENAAARITNCSITIPPVTNLPIPPPI